MQGKGCRSVLAPLLDSPNGSTSECGTVAASRMEDVFDLSPAFYTLHGREWDGYVYNVMGIIQLLYQINTGEAFLPAVDLGWRPSTRAAWIAGLATV
jgi:hypothetical protein